MIWFFRELKEEVLQIKRLLELLVHAQKKTEPAEQLLSINRHQLGSIDLSDLKELTPAEQDIYDGRIAGSFDVLERDAKEIIQAQLEFIGEQAGTWEQSLVGRGTINGVSLLLEKWRDAKNRHVKKSEQPPEFDPHNPQPEIT